MLRPEEANFKPPEVANGRMRSFCVRSRLICQDSDGLITVLLDKTDVGGGSSKATSPQQAGITNTFRLRSSGAGLSSCVSAPRQLLLPSVPACFMAVQGPQNFIIPGSFFLCCRSTPVVPCFHSSKLSTWNHAIASMRVFCC